MPADHVIMNLQQALYVAGTDTGIGKTHVAASLVRALRAQGVDAVGMKPVASGCDMIAGALRNEDALQLLDASGLDQDSYALVNPIALPMPACPHIAATAAGMTVDLDRIEDAFAQLAATHDLVIVEGVGGWSVPLSGPPGSWFMQAELVRQLALPVLLVVGLRLGCINHGLLSAEGIIADGCPLLGWIGNSLIPGWDQQKAVIDTLTALMPAVALGLVDHAGQVDETLAASVRERIPAF